MKANQGRIGSLGSPMWPGVPSPETAGVLLLLVESGPPASVARSHPAEPFCGCPGAGLALGLHVGLSAQLVGHGRLGSCWLTHRSWVASFCLQTGPTVWPGTLPAESGGCPNSCIRQVTQKGTL